METSENNNLQMNFERIFLLWLAVFLISGLYLLLASQIPHNIVVGSVTGTSDQSYHVQYSIFDTILIPEYKLIQFLILLFAMFLVLLAFISSTFADANQENELRISSMRKIIVLFLIWNFLIYLVNFYSLTIGPLLIAGLFVGLIIMEFQIKNVELNNKDELKKIGLYMFISTGLGFFIFVLIQQFFINSFDYSSLYTYSAVLGIYFIVLAIIIQFKFKLKWNPAI